MYNKKAVFPCETQLFLRLAHKFIAIACKICYHKYVYIQTGFAACNNRAGLTAKYLRKGD
jgi:hypothetical protein